MGWMKEVFRPLITHGEFEPTAYLGRVLVGVNVQSTPHDPISGTQVLRSIREPRVCNYELRVDLYSASAIPAGAFDKLCVEVTFGPAVNAR